MSMDDDMQTFARKVRTNGDRIRAMSDEEIADFLNNLRYNCCDAKCGDCPVSGYNDVECDCDMLHWIKNKLRKDDQ